MLLATGKGSGISGDHGECGRNKCGARLNTGAGSSYASLLHRLGERPVRKEFKWIEIMMQASNRD